jgi:hypothetical protein
MFNKNVLRRVKVAGKKYDKLITTNTEHAIPEWSRKLREKLPRDPSRGRILTWLDDDVIPGAFYYESFVVLKPTPAGYFNDPPMIHDDWDEVIGMYGTNPANPEDLGGEIQLTIDDEVHSFTKSSAVFIPKGLKHGPFVFKKVTTPIIVVTTGPSKKYTQTLPAGWEKMIGTLK